MDLVGISKKSAEYASTRIKPADRHGMEWHGVASAGRLLPEWRNGNWQYPRRVFKRGMVSVLPIGSALFSNRVLRLRPT